MKEKAGQTKLKNSRKIYEEWKPKKKTLKGKCLDHLQKKFRQKGPTTVQEVIQQWYSIIKRYLNRTAQFKHNRVFENNQKKFYQQNDEKKSFLKIFRIAWQTEMCLTA